LEIDAEGRIVTGGGAFNTSQLDNNFFLTRFMPNGTIDQSFGIMGIRELSGNSNESIFDVEILNNTDIIAAGSTGSFGSEFALVRITQDGDQDLSFGNNGWATTQIEPNFNSIRSIVVDDASIYAAGNGRNNDYSKMVMAKYINAGMSSGIDQLIADHASVKVFPNPMVENFSVTLDLLDKTKLSIDLVDMHGRLLTNLLQDQSVSAGKNKFDFIRPQGIAKGFYFIQLNLENGVVTKKIQF